jgi:hypothetical protein
LQTLGFPNDVQAPELAYPSSPSSHWVPSKGKYMDFESLGKSMENKAWELKPLEQQVLCVGPREQECWGKASSVKLQGRQA